MDEAALTFRTLLSYDLEPGESQRRASRLLPGRVAASHMSWWTPGDPVPGTGQRLLIGVAVWSNYDLRMLDVIEQVLASETPPAVTVQVFDTDTVLVTAEFERYIPGIGEVFQTPVVGLWIDGHVQRHGCGFEGRQIVAEALGLSMDELMARPVTATPR